MLPNDDSYIDLDTEILDEYGLPRPRRHWKLSETDMRLHNDMKRHCQEILEASRAQILSISEHPATNHEIGGCRMGSDPRSSIVDSSCRAHDVPNLYVDDASVFPSSSEKNPTLTIMALASRTADLIADRLQKKEV
jgi:choline dehydrogenase-like flavoprotein